MGNFILFLISLHFLLLLPIPATSWSFNFPSFNYSIWSTNITLKLDATPSDKFIDLTRNRQDQSSSNSMGGVLYNDRVQLWDKKTGNQTNFTTQFSFTIRNSDYSDCLYPYPNWTSCIGDGLAFFLAPYDSLILDISQNNTGADGYGGGGLGLFYGIATGPNTSNIAVEFDTFQNEWDPDNSHIGINIFSVVSLKKISCNGSLWNWMRENSRPWEASIGYDSSSHNLSVVLSCSNKSDSHEICSLDYIVNLTDYLPEQVTIGFSAANGLASELRQLNSWQFSSSLEVENSNEGGVAPAPEPEGGISIKKKIGIAVGGAAMIMITVLGLFLFFRWRKNRENRADDDVVLDVPTGPREFSYAELAAATSNFDDKQKVGEGGFGGVYRGFMSDLNIDVAVKRISKGSTQGMKEYASEVKIISRLRHRNLVHLVGWCHQQKELLLVYEFMPNGSLDSYLFRNRGFLTWELRYRIALDLASALQYLHEGWNQCVIHRDIKPSNVILDSNFNAKLGDFGLARLVDNEKGSQTRTQTTDIAGTMGYMAPEYVITGKASKESDVYSFGIVLLEIACGRKAIEKMVDSSEIRLVEWVWELYVRGKHLEAADPCQGMDPEKLKLECMIVVGLWCAQQDYNPRPSIGQAINVLKLDAPLPILLFRGVPVPSLFSITSSHGSTKCDISHTQHLSSNYAATDFCVLNKSSPSSSPSASILRNTC